MPAHPEARRSRPHHGQRASGPPTVWCGPSWRAVKGRRPEGPPLPGWYMAPSIDTHRTRRRMLCAHFIRPWRRCPPSPHPRPVGAALVRAPASQAEGLAARPQPVATGGGCAARPTWAAGVGGGGKVGRAPNRPPPAARPPLPACGKGGGVVCVCVGGGGRPSRWGRHCIVCLGHRLSVRGMAASLAALAEVRAWLRRAGRGAAHTGGVPQAANEPPPCFVCGSERVAVGV